MCKSKTLNKINLLSTNAVVLLDNGIFLCYNIGENSLGGRNGLYN